MTIEKVAETIAAMLDISLLPADKGRIRRTLNRLKTQIKHIRF
ncbi:hypothetical protein ACFQZT_03395 [Paenibacillus sp. GCM10027628]